MKSPAWITLLLLLLASAACVDDELDLSKGIDTEVSIGGEHFGLYLGATDTFRLSKFIPPDNGLISVDSNGTYTVVMRDTVIAQLPAIEVAPVEITSEDSKFYEMQMDDIMFDPKISPLATSFDVTIPATGLPATPMPN
ncbi:MAG: hypothetical protein LBF55_04630, partial [Prevotellaceae bacterium]|nr:hypothetical protein [Prevotellaceae bacterium]